MAATKNPKQIEWTDPTTYEDGTPFGASEFKAYELGAAQEAEGDVTPLLVLPTAYGVGASPIPDAVVDVKDRVQWIALRTIAKTDEVSEWSGRLPVIYTRVPLAPSAFSAT